MIHSENIILFMGTGTLIISCLAAIVAAFWITSKHERHAARSRKIHRDHMTHYERLQARLLLASGSVTKGPNK